MESGKDYGEEVQGSSPFLPRDVWGAAFIQDERPYARV